MNLRPPLWIDRHQAGLALGQRLAGSAPLPADARLLALPRGGVVVAAAMAEVLHRPVWSWSVRKIADPAWPELALGAIAGDDTTVWRQDLDPRQQDRALSCGWLQGERQELERRRRLYGDPAPEVLRDHPLIVVDDGIATGTTVRAALRSLQPLQPRSLTLAVPVLDRSLLKELLPLVDHLEALAVVDDLRAVGHWYSHFLQVSDAEVIALLARQALPGPTAQSARPQPRPTGS